MVSEVISGAAVGLQTASQLRIPDWASRDGHYCVRLKGRWIMVPDEAVITEPNRAGRTIAWPIKGPSETFIRCFMSVSTA
jgi:hypothetical protein